MLLACYSHKHITYRIRTIIRKAINIDVSKIDKFYLIAEQGYIIIHPIWENLDIF
ncbi:hypothetical protein [Wolbachia endosymbiont of Glossina morsitans morsitans]|uniref:hypothetical protein n=1 Tax=Wolbachia endosymbiont of Glossina morsitans morsitans TaxID=1150948 RepID=UPI000ABF5731|nr:hypothetical protein [Wolbachia endosymbiont of Glossina morsitans morsitans]